MALLTRDANASVDASTAMFAPQITGLIAGEALDACAPCRIHTDGKAYMSNGTAADAEAKVDGFTPRAAAAGQAITLFGPGTRMRYGTSLTPGANYYLGGTDGRLDTAATTGGANPIARAIDTTDIVVLAKQ
jgi:hypothetical protein